MAFWFSQVVEPAVGKGHLNFIANFETVDVLTHQTSFRELGRKWEVDFDQQFEGIPLDVSPRNRGIFSLDHSSIDLGSTYHHAYSSSRCSPMLRPTLFMSSGNPNVKILVSCETTLTSNNFDWNVFDLFAEPLKMKIMMPMTKATNTQMTSRIELCSVSWNMRHSLPKLSVLPVLESISEASSMQIDVSPPNNLESSYMLITDIFIIEAKKRLLNINQSLLKIITINFMKTGNNRDFFVNNFFDKFIQRLNRKWKSRKKHCQSGIFKK